MNNSVSIQHIHDILVSNFHFDKAEELHDILTIIISSFLSEDIVEYYTIKDKMINKEFIDLLINNAKEILGNNYDKYLDSIQKTEFKNSFEVCRTIYDTYKSDPMLISKLFQQFKKYNSYSLSKNEIWTEPEIARIMFHELSKLINTNESITISDPCVGGGNLIREFMKNCSNLTIKGCEINKRLSMNLKLDLIINGFNSDHIYNNDYFDIDVNLLTSDCSIVNPPYTKKISKHDCLEFVNRTLTHSKYCSYIIPKNKLLTERKELERLIENHSVISIIELGEIFKSVASTGDIIILTCSSNKTNDKTKYINISNLANEHKKVIRSNEYKFTDKGNELLNSYYEDKIKITEYIPTVDQPYPEENLDMIVNIKNNIINDYGRVITFISELKLLSNNDKCLINKILTNNIQKINNIILSDVVKETLITVKFTDVFEKVKHKKTVKTKYENISIQEYNSLTNEEKELYYPFIWRSKFNNGLDSYIKNYYDIDTEENIYCIADLSGDCSIHTNKFSLGEHMLTIKPKQEYIDIDPFINSTLLTYQFINMNFNYSNLITFNKLKDIMIKIYVGEKFYEDDFEPTKVKLADYFIPIKFKSVKVKETESGCYPLYGATINNEHVKMISEYNIDIGDDKFIQLNKAGSVGYCFIRTGKFSLISSVYLLKPKINLDLEVNIKLLSIQLSNMGFGFSNPITLSKLKNLEVYLKI